MSNKINLDIMGPVYGNNIDPVLNDLAPGDPIYGDNSFIAGLLGIPKSESIDANWVSNILGLDGKTEEQTRAEKMKENKVAWEDEQAGYDRVTAEKAHLISTAEQLEHSAALYQSAQRAGATFSEGETAQYITNLNEASRLRQQAAQIHW